MSIVDFFRENQLTSRLYRKLKSTRYGKPFSTRDLMRIQPSLHENRNIRINLVLPSLKERAIFGGTSTAIRVMREQIDFFDAEARIIVVGNEKFDPKYTYVPNDFLQKASNELSFLSEDRNLDIRVNDIFILTEWRTAYAVEPIMELSLQSFSPQIQKFVYLIQDYEPGFFPWSTEYLLAESTYRIHNEDIIAVFNSEELRNFFHAKHYSYAKEFDFKPCLDERLRSILESVTAYPRRDKRILIYGRPSTKRNAFEMVCDAVSVWVREYPGSSEWEIVSLGEEFDNVTIGSSTIRSLGKVSLEDYARVMLTSFAGISLMVSPHPSYPPLEMSTFGIRTITNPFENKDLSGFNQNLVSVDPCTPETIAQELSRICSEYGCEGKTIDLDSDYVRGGSFGIAMRLLSEELESRVVEG